MHWKTLAAADRLSSRRCTFTCEHPEHVLYAVPTGGCPRPRIDLAEQHVGVEREGKPKTVAERELKDRIDGMMAVHDYSNAFGHMVSQEKKQETRAKFPPVEHPVVRTHPETGRKILYVNRFFVDHLVGVSKEESIDLMKQLCRQAEFPEYQVRWHWEKDSVAFWDNRAVQHYASSDYWPDVRVMERASVIGDRPF